MWEKCKSCLFSCLTSFAGGLESGWSSWVLILLRLLILDGLIAEGEKNSVGETGGLGATSS